MNPQRVIAHYRLTSKLGAGGMGEVWRATDTRLGREVAIKILPDAFARRPERMARFEREAQVLASLNHPNIAQIYGAEERALIMELVAGETLKGPLPPATALDYAKQIACALEAAHEKGIIHRDLKPGNIMITAEGIVKVLDFGLAYITEQPAAINRSISRTITISPTRTGAILGTAPYMAPEQARGKRVDRRADIWAFGCVLYEMLTGQRAFKGDTTSDILAAIIKEQPDLMAIPAAFRPVIDKCLRKDPHARWRDIGDARMALEEPQALAAPQPATRRNVLPWAIVGFISLLAIALALVLWRDPKSVEGRMLAFSVDLGPDGVAGRDTTIALSRDGTTMVFPARTADGTQALAIRYLNQTSSRVLAGTENAINPFFSPDGAWVGFFADAKMKKVSVQGGSPITLCDAPAGRGGTWGSDGYIIAALDTNTGLSRMSDQGGQPELLTKPASPDETHRWPQLLPDRKTVLFTSSPLRVDFTHATIEAISLKTGQRKTVQRDAFFGRYLPNGELVFLRGQTLFAAPFDAKTAHETGPPAPAIEGVAASTFGGGQFTFSDTGTFAYLPGKLAGELWRVVSMDSGGNVSTLISKPDRYFEPVLSPDGKRLALYLGSQDIWVYNFARETFTRLTFTGRNRNPVWTPDGKGLVYLSAQQGRSAIMWLPSDGGGEPEALLQTECIPTSFTPDGRTLLIMTAVPGHSEVWAVPIDDSYSNHPKAGTAKLLLRISAVIVSLEVSPDGRWLAYTSDESGTREVYVRQFTVGSLSGGEWQISSGGGWLPVWSRANQELFYSTTDRHMVVVDYRVNGNSFEPGNPHLWTDKTLPRAPGGQTAFDLMPDAKRIIALAPLDDASKPKGNLHATFLVNYFDELRREQSAR